MDTDPSAVARHPSRDDDSRMMQAAIRWNPYGGPPAEDIFVWFGLSELEFFAHIDRLVARGQPRLPERLAASLRATVRRRTEAAARD